MPAPPLTARQDQMDPINFENRLHILPSEVRLQIDRPWYYYDIVEPARRFRRVMGPHQGNTAEEEEEDIYESDHGGDDKSPVVCHRPYVESHGHHSPLSSFHCTQQKVCCGSSNDGRGGGRLPV